MVELKQPREPSILFFFTTIRFSKMFGVTTGAALKLKDKYHDREAIPRCSALNTAGWRVEGTRKRLIS